MYPSEQRIIAAFLAENQEYERVEWDFIHDDLTVYFKDSKEPWGLTEFEIGTPTRQSLDELVRKLLHAFEEV